MNRILILLTGFFLLGLFGCSKPSETVSQGQNSSATATPNSSPAMVIASPSVTTPSPGANVVAPPIPNSQAGNNQAKTDAKSLPPVIGDRLYRALTLEEINQLPPATRDMILKAQGRLPASPSPTPKKK